MRGRKSKSHLWSTDRQVTIQQLKDDVKAFCQARDWNKFHDPKELAIAISTEAAELLELTRFKTKAQIGRLFSAPASRERVEDELADIFYFVLRFSQMNGIELGRALRAKLVKNVAKYPVHMARGSNKKYTEF